MIQRDAFDSATLGMEVGRVLLPADPGWGEDLHEFEMVVAEVPFGDVDGFAAMGAWGFRFVTARIDLELPTPPRRLLATPKLEPLDRVKDREEVLKFRNAFPTSRIAADARLGEGFAAYYHARWLENCLDGKYGDAILGVRNKEDREVLDGFVSLSYYAGIGRLNLMAVREGARGKGVADHMIAESIKWAAKRKGAFGPGLLVVGVSAGNIRAMRVYLRNRFNARGSVAVFHWFREGSDR